MVFFWSVFFFSCFFILFWGGGCEARGWTHLRTPNSLGNLRSIRRGGRCVAHPSLRFFFFFSPSPSSSRALCRRTRYRQRDFESFSWSVICQVWPAHSWSQPRHSRVPTSVSQSKFDQSRFKHVSKKVFRIFSGPQCPNKKRLECSGQYKLTRCISYIVLSFFLWHRTQALVQSEIFPKFWTFIFDYDSISKKQFFRKFSENFPKIFRIFEHLFLTTTPYQRTTHKKCDKHVLTLWKRPEFWKYGGIWLQKEQDISRKNGSRKKKG